jgi:hypothetical protein
MTATVLALQTSLGPIDVLGSILEAEREIAAIGFRSTF